MLNRRQHFLVLFALFLALSIGQTAAAQTVVFSETFTGADQANMSGFYNFDHDWFFSSSGPGPDVISGVLVTYLGTLWDSGVMNDPYSIDPGTEDVTVEFDFTVNSIGTGGDFFILQLFDDILDGGINMFINTSAAFDDVVIEAFDNSIGYDVSFFGGPGAFTAGTSYHFTGLFQNGNSLDCTISIIATGGPGGDVVNGQAISLGVDAGTMGPIRSLGFACSEGLTFDNLTITTSPQAAAMPATNRLGGAFLAFALAMTAGIALRQSVRPMTDTTRLLS